MDHMRTSSVIAVVALVSTLASACASDEPGGGAGESRFVGRWFVEETDAHALYAASTYDLREDGSIELVWDAGFYDAPQGQVRSPDGAIRCVFGASWGSPDGAHLLVDGVCSDDVARDIQLLFTSDPAANTAGATVVIDEVGGERGWQEPQWGWSFTRCAGTDPCHPDW